MRDCDKKSFLQILCVHETDGGNQMDVSAGNHRPDSLPLCEQYILMKAGDRVQKADAAHAGLSGAFSISTLHLHHFHWLHADKEQRVIVFDYQSQKPTEMLIHWKKTPTPS